MQPISDDAVVRQDLTHAHLEDPEDCIGDPVHVNFETGEVTPLGRTDSGLNTPEV